jgi:hypothetical protein
LRAPAALVESVARAAPASMRAFSPMAPLVVMLGLVAPVAWAAPRAWWASTPRHSSAVPAASAATPEQRARARWV